MSATRSRVEPLGTSETREGRPGRDDLASEQADGGRSYFGSLRGTAIRTESNLALDRATSVHVEHNAPAAEVGIASRYGEPPRSPAGFEQDEHASASPSVVRSYVGPLRGFSDSTLEGGDPTPAEHNDILAPVHVPTVNLVEQLRGARLKLQRAAGPELRLSPAIRALLRTERRLGRPLRVAICGEINAGKSSLANLLAGIESLPTAVVSNTLFPTLLYYSAEPEVWTVHAGGKRERLRTHSRLPRASILRVDVGLPSQRLAAMQVLDLPGLPDSRSGAAVDLAAHHIDAAIWCTVSTQAWKESERMARSMLSPRLNARSLLVATHGDLLREADRAKLMARLRDEVGTSFAGIVLLSTLEAIAIRDNGHTASPVWAASGAEALETALAALLTSVREQRADAALSVTSRIAHRSLVRIESHFNDDQ